MVQYQKRKDMENNTSNQEITPPSLEEVIGYFIQKIFPQEEAEIFYNYFTSTDWMTDSNIPIHDWRAHADKWMWNLDCFRGSILKVVCELK